ncbi:MAG: hypothetical protein NTX71_00645, partial [Candidatus Aureabacteria bacterium]|nr:hypothetical protein [Candidatus Auribacterota bacterium]
LTNGETKEALFVSASCKKVEGCMSLILVGIQQVTKSSTRYSPISGLKERERPAVRELKRQYPPQELIEQYLQLIGGTREEICRRGRQLPERTILMELLYRFCRITQQEIGSYMGGLDYSSVSNVRRRLLSRIGHDQQLERKFNAFLKHFNQMKS